MCECSRPRAPSRRGPWTSSRSSSFSRTTQNLRSPPRRATRSIRLPRPAVEAFLGRGDVPSEMRQYFARRGFTAGGTVEDPEAPLLEAGEALPEVEGDGGDDEGAAVIKLAKLGVVEKMKLATNGTREQRSLLVRDPNRLVAAAVLSSPKLTESEVEQFARMANVAEDVLRVIGSNRAWTKNYGVVAGLVKNPKTPLALSMTLLQRVNDRDVKMLAIDRNIPEPLRIAARKRASANRGGPSVQSAWTVRFQSSAFGSDS